MRRRSGKGIDEIEKIWMKVMRQLIATVGAWRGGDGDEDEASMAMTWRRGRRRDEDKVEYDMTKVRQ